MAEELTSICGRCGRSAFDTVCPSCGFDLDAILYRHVRSRPTTIWWHSFGRPALVFILGLAVGFILGRARLRL